MKNINYKYVFKNLKCTVTPQNMLMTIIILLEAE